VRVLLTGSAGFTARHLVPRLRQEPSVFIAGSDLALRGMSYALDEYRQCDLTFPRHAVHLVSHVKPDWIFHLAGLFRGSAPDLYRVNLMGAVNLLESVKTHAPQASVLLVGSAAEYGIWPASEMPLGEDHACRPVGPYGASKFAVTLAAKDYVSNAGLKVVVARPFNLVGAGMPASLVAGAIAQRAKSALAHGDKAITIGNTEAERDFVAVEDAVDGYVKLLQAGAWGEVFNICSGQTRSIRSILETLLSFAPRPLQVVEDPALKRSNDIPVIYGDPTKARKRCGFTCKIALRDSLRSAWEAG